MTRLRKYREYWNWSWELFFLFLHIGRVCSSKLVGDRSWNGATLGEVVQIVINLLEQPELGLVVDTGESYSFFARVIWTFRHMSRDGPFIWLRPCCVRSEDCSSSQKWRRTSTFNKFRNMNLKWYELKNIFCVDQCCTKLSSYYIKLLCECCEFLYHICPLSRDM